ncbi:MAG: DUF3164 family protein [Oscillospiraceae bacterium]|nr:DUF3164 family protein [Oscillospiraceae bacterium]
MTAEEFAQYQAFKAEQAKKEADARIEALRGSYADMSEAFINKTIKKLTPLSKSIRKKKAEVLDEFSALQRLKAELLDIDGKEMPKSHTFTNKAGDKRVTIGVYETDNYDDTVEEGIAIVKQYIESLAQDEKSAQLVKMVMSLLARSANGALKASRVVRLHRLADESGDERFIEGVRIIEAAYRPAISRTYIRCEVRTIDPETQVVKDWEAIPLGITES